MTDDADTVRAGLHPFANRTEKGDARAALDRLVAELDEAHALTEKALAYAHRFGVRTQAAEAERDRLREALEKIADPSRFVVLPYEVAREALGDR